MKIIILILSGVAAGLVARQIKASIRSSLKEMEKRLKVENLFGQQISKEVAEKMMENEGNIESSRMQVAIMFIDIRNFTQFILQKTPEDIVGYQNAFLSIVIDIIARNGGIVNQILGDGCMATFGAPVVTNHHSQQAVNAAIEILKEIESAIDDGRLSPTKIGIGIHAGEAVTGNIGTADRKQYSISGNVVVLASRIEQLNKVLGSQILISENIASVIDQKIDRKFKGEVTLKGWPHPVGIYELA